jgi:phosphate transport system substrate-binding protein
MKGVSMAKRLLTSIVSLGFVTSVIMASPAQANEANLKGAGSSYANKFVVACAVADPTTSVAYNPAGSGTGRSSYTNGTVDFGASDAATTSNLTFSGLRAGKETKYSYIPVVGGPIAMLYTVPGLKTGELRLDSDAIARILSGQVKTWNDPVIAKLQTADVAKKLPKKAIRVVYRSASSGTSENLTDYLRQNVPSVWTKAKNGTIASGNPAGRMPLGSIGAANSQALVSTVKATKFAIGYADLSDAVTSKVPFATIKNANGEWVAPTATASSKFLESFSGASGFNASTGAMTLDFKKKIAGAYNMSLVTYAIVDKGSSSAKSVQVEAFVKYMLNTCGPQKGAALGYAPISGALLTKANAIAEGIS